MPIDFIKAFAVAFLFLIAVTQASARSSNLDSLDFGNAVDSGSNILIDSLTIKGPSHYDSRSNSNGDLFSVVDFLQRQPSVNIEIDFIINTTYDTISHHAIRTRASDLIHDFVYFGLAPSRYTVREVVVPDKPEDRRAAKRLVLGRLVSNDQFSILMSSEKDLADCIDKILSLTTNSSTYSTISSKQRTLLDAAAKKFSKEVYQPFLNTPIALPNFTTFQEGKVDVLISPEVEFEEDSFIIPADTFLITSPSSSQLAALNFPVLSSQRLISSEQVTALITLLGKDFEYEADISSSLPLDEEMVAGTKKVFDILKQQLPVNYYVNELGSCHAHVFWQFDWNLVDAYVPRMVTVDEEQNLVSIEFFDADLSPQFVTYAYNDDLVLEVDHSTMKLTMQASRWPRLLLVVGGCGILLICWLVIKFLFPRAWPRHLTR